VNEKIKYIKDLFFKDHYDVLINGIHIHNPKSKNIEALSWYRSGKVLFHCYYNRKTLLFNGPYNSWDIFGRPLIEAEYINGKAIKMKKYQYTDTFD
jgi:hypothetical protein